MSELYLIAQIAGRTVAIQSDDVASVVDIGEVTTVPRAPATVRGLAALRSRVVTVIDTRIALGLPSSADSRRAVIMRAEGHDYALLVDTLDDVAPFTPVPLANGVTLDAAWSLVARGLVERDGEPVLAVDLTRLIPGVAALAA